MPVPKEPRLTNKQKLFIDAYMALEFNATQAAIQAGYSAKSAAEIGAENIRKPQIMAEISKRLGERRERFHKEEITQERVLQEMAKVAFANITDFLEFKTEKTVVGKDDKGQPIFDYTMVVKTKESKDVDGSAIQSVRIRDDGSFEFKLHSKLDALNAIGRHLGMFKDKLEVIDGTTIDVTLEDEE